MDAIEFGTDGWRATLDEFTDERVRAVGQAVADTLRGEGADAPVAVGYDARDTSRGFAKELSRVLCANGYDILLPERDCPTPVVAWTVLDRGLSGALMVTASHNPASYNGVKFIPDDGAPALPEVTDALEANLREPDPRPEDEWGRVEQTDLVGPYIDHVLGFVGGGLGPDESASTGGGDSASSGEDDTTSTGGTAGPDLDGLTVAYDAMHGSGRGVTDAVLERAGADVTHLRTERDPEFGGTPPEPTGERLGELEARVRDGDAAVGVANDGDADRIGVVTPGRGYLDPNLLFAAVYDSLLESDASDAVRTVSTTFLVDRIAEEHGVGVEETAVGFKWVAAAMAERDALLGGEESGGFGVRGHLRNKDGVLLALVVAAAHAERPLDERVDALLAEFGEIHQDRVSVECPDDRKGAVLDALEGDLPDEVAGEAVEKVVTVDGFKILLADGSWLLMRPSGTEPKMRIYAEAESEERVVALLDEGRRLVEPRI